MGLTATHSQQLIEQETLAGAVGPDHNKRHHRPLDVPQCVQALLLYCQLGVPLDGQHHCESARSHRRGLVLYSVNAFSG